MDAVALAWVLAQPTVGSVIFGARNIEQVKANKRGMEVELPAGILESLSEATNFVKQHLGKNPDIWESPGRYNL
jgi:aryl-alcohol dehydrogenase-like predicted oxidoreductase